MKRLAVFFSLITCLFLLNNKSVNADALAVNLFCDNRITSYDEALNYNFDKYDNYVYAYGDEVACYIVVGHTGSDGFNQVDIVLPDNDGLEFVRFEKNDIWNDVIEESNKYTVISDEEIDGNFVVGKLYYLLNNNSQHTELNITVLGMPTSATISTVKSEKPVDIQESEDNQDNEEHTTTVTTGKKNDTTKTSNDDSNVEKILLYVSLGVNVLLLIVVVVLVLTKKKYNNNVM